MPIFWVICTCAFNFTPLNQLRGGLRIHESTNCSVVRVVDAKPTDMRQEAVFQMRLMYWVVPVLSGRLSDYEVEQVVLDVLVVVVRVTRSSTS